MADVAAHLVDADDRVIVPERYEEELVRVIRRMRGPLSGQVPPDHFARL